MNFVVQLFLALGSCIIPRGIELTLLQLCFHIFLHTTPCWKTDVTYVSKICIVGYSGFAWGTEHAFCFIAPRGITIIMPTLKGNSMHNLNPIQRRMEYTSQCFYELCRAVIFSSWLMYYPQRDRINTVAAMLPHISTHNTMLEDRRYLCIQNMYSRLFWVCLRYGACILLQL